MLRFLTEADVEQLLDMNTAVDAVEDAFRRWGAGEADNTPRMRSKAPGIVLHTMSAAATYLGLVGYKSYTTTRAGARFHVALFDQQAGGWRALIEADRLGQMRTGAATGVAVEWLAVPDAAEMGIIGTGHQARTQLEAVATVRPIKEVFVYSRHVERRERFAAEMAARLSIIVTPCDRPQAAVEELPIVVTATSSPHPVLDGGWLSPGTLLCAVGNNWLGRAEIDAEAVRLADAIVCDSVPACRHEAGDFTDALEKGIFDWSRAVDLADVVAGRAVGRSQADNIVLFKSVGLAIEDVAVGAVVLHKAAAAGLGRILELP